MANERFWRLISSVLQIMLCRLPVLLMAIVCGITFLLMQVNTPQTDEVATQPKHHTVDYTMDSISAIVPDETGTTKHRLTGVRINHYEDDLTYDITYPALHVYASDRLRAIVYADLSKVNGDDTVVDLYNNARVIHAQDSGARQDPLATANSTYLQVLLNDNIVCVNKPAELHRGPSIVNANDLTFNSVTRQVQLLGNVRGRIGGLGAPKQ